MIRSGQRFQSGAPLHGYEIVEISVTAGSPAAGRRISEVPWPDGAVMVAVTHAGEMTPALPTMTIRAGERVVLVAPVHTNGQPAQSGRKPTTGS